MHEPKGVAFVERERWARVQMVPNTACVSDACYVCRWQVAAPSTASHPRSGWGGVHAVAAIYSDLAGLAFERSPGSRRPRPWLVEPRC
eukprot:6813760-Prymnesium_polylepis.1